MNPDSVKTWLEIRISGSAEALEGVANLAFELGALGTEEIPEGLRIFFAPIAGRPDPLGEIGKYAASLRDLGFAVSDVSSRAVPEEDWGLAWKDHFKPIRVGRRFVIKPPWETWAAEAGDVVIDISPKMAFGTGSHETTRLCLELLESLDVSGLKALDVGTGSGILAVAAARLGAVRVDAVDVEEESVENTGENALLNGVADRIRVQRGSIEVVRGESYDLVLANIDRRTLAPMLPDLARLVRTGGTLILSGILTSEAEALSGSLGRPPFRLLHSRTLGEWSAFSAELLQPEKFINPMR
jgi:ribosomal protein L11 methyltransferase